MTLVHWLLHSPCSDSWASLRSASWALSPPPISFSFWHSLRFCWPFSVSSVYPFPYLRLLNNLSIPDWIVVLKPIHLTAHWQLREVSMTISSLKYLNLCFPLLPVFSRLPRTLHSFFSFPPHPLVCLLSSVPLPQAGPPTFLFLSSLLSPTLFHAEPAPIPTYSCLHLNYSCLQQNLRKCLNTTLMEKEKPFDLPWC